MKLRGRAQAFPARRERKMIDGARGAHTRACHGPLERLLDVINVPWPPDPRRRSTRSAYVYQRC